MGILPALIISIIVLRLTVLYIKWYGRKISTHDLNSISWLKQNRRKIVLFIALPALLIQAPMMEEMVFRAPLIVLFEEEGTIAWIAITVSAIVFAGLHSTTFVFTQKVVATTADQLGSDDLAYEVAKLRAKTSSKRLYALLVWRFALMTTFGVILGIVAVSQHSLWMAIILHSAWNLFSLILPLLIITVKTLVVLTVKLAQHTSNPISRRFKSKFVVHARTDDLCT